MFPNYFISFTVMIIKVFALNFKKKKVEKVLIGVGIMTSVCVCVCV